MKNINVYITFLTFVVQYICTEMYNTQNNRK